MTHATSPGAPPIALTIAGSDSGGGAGIQADLATFARLGVFGTSAITAVTAQNTVGVHSWEPVSVELVRAQVDAVASDLRPSAIKSGMLGSAPVARAVAEAIRAHSLYPYVLDPVLVATSGDRLLDTDALRVLIDELVPLCAMVTPNLHEAAALVDGEVRTPEQMEGAARRLVEELGASAALVKGGHLDDDRLVDVLFDGSAIRRFEHARIVTRATHGTGCVLSAGIAACLARGATLHEAVERAIAHLLRALDTAPAIGTGHGPAIAGGG